MRHNCILWSVGLNAESNRLKGIRTIALRLTGTEEAKAELEEIGEDTENVITTQSKLRSTVMEATKVASNGYKGFDILNPNGSYKSTYEIKKLSPYKVIYMH